MTTAIILAAGASRRFGSPKALAEICGMTALDRLLLAVTEAKVAHIVVVTGFHRNEIEPKLLKHKKLTLVYNKDHILGQTASFQAGLRAAPESDGVLLCPVDVPLVRPATIRALIDAGQDGSVPLVIPAFRGRKGHPPLFHPVLRDELLALSPHSGINEFIHRHDAEVRCLSVEDPGVVRTFNTPEELSRLLNEIQPFS